VAARPRIRVIERVYNGHLGAPATTAAAAATTEFIVFLDNDPAADPWWLANIFAPLDDRRSKASVALRFQPMRGRPGFRTKSTECSAVLGDCPRSERRSSISSATMAVRCEDLLATGGIIG